MSDDLRHPDDIASQIEDLWGPREVAPLDDDVAPFGDVWVTPAATESGESIVPASRRMGRVRAAAEVQEEPVPRSPDSWREDRDARSSAEFEAVRAYVDMALSRETISMRAELSGALTSLSSDLRSELGLVMEVVRASEQQSVAREQTLRAQFDAVLADRMAVSRAETAAEAEARLASAESRLVVRLDQIAAEAADGTAALARLDLVERELMGRLAELREQLVSLEDARSMQSNGDGLEAVHALERRLEAAEARLAERPEAEPYDVQPTVDAAVELVRATLDARLAEQSEIQAELRRSVRADLDAVRADVARRLAEASGVSRDGMVTRSDVDAVRSELRSAVSAEVATQIAGLRSTSGAGATVVPVLPPQRDTAFDEDLNALLEAANHRFGLLAEQVAADVARPGSTRRRGALRRSDAVEAVPKDAVVQQVVAVLRSDLEAVLTKLASAQTAMERKITRLAEAATNSQEEMLDRLDAMAGWVLAEATKVTGGRTPVVADQLAPLRSDVRMLEEQLAELKAVVADMRRRSTAPRRQPLLRNPSAQQT